LIILSNGLPFGESLTTMRASLLTHDGVMRIGQVVTGIQVDPSELPGRLSLRGNYPNPFSNRTHLQIDLSESASVVIEIFDLNGRRVQFVEAGKLDAGFNQQIELTMPSASSGVYFYRVLAKGVTGTQLASGKLILLR